MSKYTLTDEEYMKRINLEDEEAQEHFDMIDDADEQCID